MSLQKVAQKIEDHQEIIESFPKSWCLSHLTQAATPLISSFGDPLPHLIHHTTDVTDGYCTPSTIPGRRPSFNTDGVSNLYCILPS